MPTPSASEPLTITPAQVARFRDDLIALSGPPAPATPLALAVSGGPDSMAMLALASAAFPDAVIAASVDHGLRAEAADEVRLVATTAARLNVPHTILLPPADWRPRSVQADARQQRYALLGEWAIANRADALATAHHADDQAETFLMRAARGSGVAGLAGIRAAFRWERSSWNGSAVEGAEAAAAVTVVRPLLDWRKAELIALAEAAALGYATDPGNADPRFDRARVRALLAHHPIDPRPLARAAAACAEADATIAALADWFHRERLRKGDAGERCYDVAELPHEIRRRLAREAIAHVRRVNAITVGSWDDGRNVETLLNALAAGRGATLAGVQASARGTLWRFRPAPPRRSA